MKIDSLNIDIIRHLRNGRIRFREIADRLGVAEGTVRSRVKKLEDEGILEITGLVDPEKMPDHTIVYIGVKLSTIELVEKGAEVARVKGVISVGVVTGRYDLILTVALKKGFSLLEFYTEALSQVSDIQSVEAFVVYKGYGIKIPGDICGAD